MYLSHAMTLVSDWLQAAAALRQEETWGGMKEKGCYL